MTGMFFANPWGLLALAAVPVLVAIHFLQERSRRVRASTLFLLERAAPLPAGGIRWEKFRNSLPFWMQLLAATALAWLLADPRWIAQESRQTVAVVLDSSASMQAARQKTLDLLARRLAAWDAVAARTDWHLLETGPGRPPLYAGRELPAMLAAARGWRPTLGTHDCSESLAIAATLVPPGAGAVILVTDRPTEVPGGVGLLSAGAAFDNVGFSGGDVEGAGDGAAWRVLVTNHGAAPQERAVTARSAVAGGEPLPLGLPEINSLAPGADPHAPGALARRRRADRAGAHERPFQLRRHPAARAARAADGEGGRDDRRAHGPTSRPHGQGGRRRGDRRRSCSRGSRGRPFRPRGHDRRHPGGGGRHVGDGRGETARAAGGCRE